MESKWLSDFLSVAETQSFSRSAALRHITQSALSRRIQQLEQWLNVSLFDRTVTPVRLSPGGEDFLPRARELLALLQTTRDEVARPMTEPAQHLSFAMLSTLSLTFFPAWVQQVNAKGMPFALTLHYQRPNLAENIAGLTSGECDFFLTYTHPSVAFGLDDTSYTSQWLGSETIIPVSVPKRDGSPLHHAGAGDVHTQFCSYGKGSFFGQVLSNAFAQRPMPLKTVYENPMSAGLKAMVMTGLGLAWIPRSLIADDLRAGRLVPAADRSWWFDVDIRLYRSTANCRPIVEQFWDALPNLQQACAMHDMLEAA